MVVKHTGLRDAKLRRGSVSIIGGLHEGCLVSEDASQISEV